MSDNIEGQSTEVPVLTLDDIKSLLVENNKQLTESWEAKLAALVPPPVEPKSSEDPDNNPYQDALKARVESDLATLTDAEKAFIADIGGEDLLAQSRVLKALSGLKASGQLTVATDEKEPDDPPSPGGKKESSPVNPITPPTEKNRLDLSGNSKPEPQTWKEAGQRTIQQLAAGNR